MSVFRKLPPIVPVVEVGVPINHHRIRERITGAGHQLTSEARHMRSAASHIEEAYRNLTKAGNTTEILDLRSELHRIINRLGELACAAEEQYNQNV